MMAGLVQFLTPLVEDIKKYWQEMPDKDRQDLLRILGQAAKVIFRKPSHEDNIIAGIFRMILKFAE